MDSFWGNIFKTKEKKEEGITAVLKKIPIFEELSRRELSSIERILHQRTYRPGEIIFHQGDAGVGMYIIEKGTVEIILEPANQVVAELSDGEFFGELALLDESPRSATARAKTECRMLGFFQSDLFGLIERDPRLGVKIVLRLASIIGDRLKHSNQQMQSLINKIHQLEAEIEKLKETSKKGSRKSRQSSSST
ncbi:MAG: cyclic nucleotide-binding domain-containing protein [Calditrichaeota bacterium]|nr:cyclic nucleotide-binding domain-containing protein [Calditrichota bacterium]